MATTGTMGAQPMTPDAPTGAASQSFCSGTNPTIASLVVTGSNIIWYNAMTGGIVLSGTTTLVNGATYYVSQNNGTCESSRFAVTVTITNSNTQTVSITASATAITSGTSVTFTATTTGTVASSDIKWYINNAFTGSTGTTYTANGLTNGMIVNAGIDQGTCNSGATSNGITMTVYVADTWTGTVNNDWNTSGNWTNGIPASYSDVTIPGTVTNMPTISAAGTCHNITLADGATFIDNNNYLNVTGAVEADRSLTPGKWHFIASPVLTDNGYAFSTQNPDNAGATLYLSKFSEPTNLWSGITVGNTEIMTPGKGYEVWTTSQVTIKLKSVYAPFGLQSLSTNLSLTCTAPYASHGWNLVGNPFPAAIDISNSGSWTQSNMGSAIYVWDPTAGNYRYKGGSGVTNITGNLIPAFQSFFVIANGASPSMTIPASAKVHGGTYYKASIADLLDFKVSGNNYQDETFINFNANATTGFDTQYDVEKLNGDSLAPQFYSIIPDKNLAVNVLPAITTNEVVQMGFSANVAGTYTITASNLSSFASGTSILLEDTKLNTFTDLNAQPVYSFSSDANDNVSRFKIHFASPNGINNITGNGGGISIYSNNNNIYINNQGTDQIKEIVVYDLLGQELLKQQVVNNTLTKIDMHYVTAYYMVKVVTTNNVYTQKVYVK
jgi:hypothetical protein